MDGQLRVLLVENHADTARLLSNLLSRDGFDVSVASSVAEATRLCRQSQFDVLACDIGLDDGDGTGVLAAAREHCPGVPGIILSGFGDDPHKATASSAGFAEYLVKPVTYEGVLAAVRRALSSVPSIPTSPTNS